jgi:hypothetical protein
MDKVIESTIEHLRALGNDEIANNLIESRFQLNTSGTFGSRLNSILSTGEIFSPSGKNALLNNLSDVNKDLLLQAVLGVYPIKDNAPEITEIIFSSDVNLNHTQLVFKELPQFRRLRLSEPLIQLLENRWRETQLCLDSEAYLASMILMGSLLEGVLLAMIIKHNEIASGASKAPTDRNGNVKRPSGWKFVEMIEVCSQLNWIRQDRAKFTDVIREFRNLVHPYVQLRKGLFPDEHTCNISWAVVTAACNDIVEWANNQ